MLRTYNYTRIFKLCVNDPGKPKARHKTSMAQRHGCLCGWGHHFLVNSDACLLSRRLRIWVRHHSWRFLSEATRRVRTRVHCPCLPPKLHPESRVGRNILMLIHSSVMKCHTDRGLPIDDMPRSSGFAAQTKVDVAARPILDEMIFRPQGSPFVKDENRMISLSLDTYNPQVNVEVSALVGSLSIPHLR